MVAFTPLRVLKQQQALLKEISRKAALLGNAKTRRAAAADQVTVLEMELWVAQTKYNRMMAKDLPEIRKEWAKADRRKKMRAMENLRVKAGTKAVEERFGKAALKKLIKGDDVLPKIKNRCK